MKRINNFTILKILSILSKFIVRIGVSKRFVANFNNLKFEIRNLKLL